MHWYISSQSVRSRVVAQSRALLAEAWPAVLPGSLIVDVILLSALLQMFWVNTASVVASVPDHFILSREHALRRSAE